MEITMTTMESENSQTYGRCRCCLQKGHHKIVTEPYFKDGICQIYQETLQECFNLLLSTNKELTNLICTSCINRLNDASEFKSLVVESEKQLLSEIGNSTFSNGEDLKLNLELDIKPDPGETLKVEPQGSSTYVHATDDCESDSGLHPRLVEVNIKLEPYEELNEDPQDCSVDEEGTFDDNVSCYVKISMDEHKKPYRKRKKYPSRKYCIVPNCGNTSTTAPDKIYFLLPRDPDVRKEWCEVMKRDVEISAKSCLYCCEDHFNIEEDTDNYMRYKIMNLEQGQRTTLRLKKGVLPHVFRCQEINQPPRKLTRKEKRKLKREKKRAEEKRKAEEEKRLKEKNRYISLSGQ